MTSLVLPFSLCLRRRTSPVPRSFHSLLSRSNLKSLARILKVCSSLSSCVLVSTFSVRWTTGSKWTSGSFSSASSSSHIVSHRQQPLRR
ncbi:hypothetical protein KCU61_g280, partial [Aureobasidium melanogenum]